jgi:hypothetical protein
LSKGNVLMVLEIRVLRGIFVPKRNGVERRVEKTVY